MISQFFEDYKRLAEIEGDFVYAHMDSLEEEELLEPFENDNSEYNQLIKKVDTGMKKIKIILEWLEKQKDIPPFLKWINLELLDFDEEDYDTLNNFTEELSNRIKELENVSSS